MAEEPPQLADAVRESGLVEPGSRGVVLVSGGADSAATLAGLAGVLGPEAVVALHLNYGLRPDSGEDEEVVRRLCEHLGVELVVERPALDQGNVQAAARRARYAAAERLRSGRGLGWVATGHTLTDLAETILYRLATSPGRRALLGLRARRGTVVRPLLGLERERVRVLAEHEGLPFRDDPSNAEPTYARNRIRAEVLPVLREIGQSPESTMAETQAELAEEAEVLERLASEALAGAGVHSAHVVSAEAVAGLDPAIRRLALRQLAERVAGGSVSLSRGRAAEIWRLAGQPEGGVVELGAGVEARIEHGHIRIVAGPDEKPGEATLTVPGTCRFGSWEVRAEFREAPEANGAEIAILDRASLTESLVVRSWRDGDRIRPLGLDGSKTLQDLFTDRKVPRSLRRTLPVVTSEGRIAWIAGVAVSQEFAASPGAPSAVLSATVVE
jgi:tRNA(Ile)-lysidine synthase